MASVPAPPTATGVAAVRMGAVFVTQATLAPLAPPVPALPTAGAVGVVCRECVCAMQATVVRTVGRKSLPPAPALGAAGPGHCAAQASVYAWRASEAQTAQSGLAQGTAKAGESVVRAAASAKMALQGKTAGKVSGLPSPVCSLRDWESEPVGRPEPEAKEPRDLEKQWREVIYRGNGQSEEPESQYLPGAAGPAFRSLMNKLGAPLVAFREILCSWSWGEVEGDAPSVQVSASSAPPLERSGNWDGSLRVALSRGTCDGGAKGWGLP